MADLLQRLRECKLVQWPLACSDIVISPALLNLDPAWDPLHADPRLDVLVENSEMSP